MKELTEDQKQVVIESIADQLGMYTIDIHPSSRLKEDLNADSLDALEIILSIEHEFNIRVNEDDILSCNTVKDVFDILATYLK